jgi:hypothetical protein
MDGATYVTFSIARLPRATRAQGGTFSVITRDLGRHDHSVEAASAFDSEAAELEYRAQSPVGATGK